MYMAIISGSLFYWPVSVLQPEGMKFMVFPLAVDIESYNYILI